MFGKNEVSSAFHNAEGRLLVTDVFETLQGEGPQIGWPAVFLRLTRCNLRCWFCDTDFERGREYSLSELIECIAIMGKRNRSNLLVITGGEPLLQNIVPLVAMMTLYHWRVAIETAGTVYVDGLSQFFDRTAQERFGHMLVCSPKTPKIHPQIEPLVAAYKYLIKEGHIDDEGFPNISTQAADSPMKLFRPNLSFTENPAPIYYSPMDEGDDEKNAANLEAARDLAMTYGRRLTIQMHKLVNVP